ncbi:MAG: hypothetical protein JSW41_04300 [Candidatus Aenigmatarchaeota archaeon]|nr:MAG: hypothetical protein JSW41_04300 [Candidatus Aenigmarchaeota archaeon]
MVFARTKILMQDNCYEEEPGEVQMRYVGPNPQKLYDKMWELMKSIFNVPDSAIQEERYNWGKGEKVEKFRVAWLLHKDMDAFSYIYVKTSLSGEGDEESGNATITIKPYMRTEYPQDTVWQRSLFYEMLRMIWHNTFYSRKRDEYTAECRHLTVYLQRRVLDFFRELRETKGKSA